MHTNLTGRETSDGKFLLRAPIIIGPLLTFLFWVLGGGKSSAAGDKVSFHGFDMRIPPAHVASIVKLDKLEYYEAAKRDSAAERQKERIENSYAKVLGLPDTASALVHAVQEKLKVVKRVLAGAGGYRAGAPRKERVATAARAYRAEAGSFGDLAGAGRMERVAQPVDLAGVRLMSRGGEMSLARPRLGDGSGTMARGVEGPNLEKLERMMTVLQRDEGGNTEIAQLTAALDRLAALQVGARQDTVKRRAAALVMKRAVAKIKALPDADDTTRGFDSAAIEAIVPEAQVVVSGEELRLELVRDVLVDGVRIPAGTPVFGTVNLNGERLRVAINSIVWQDRVLPVSLQVDDEDGLAGIHIPGAPVTDAVRESMGSEVGAIGPTVLTTGVTGQAIDAGVSLGRQLIGKKIRPVRVTVPAGYRVLLHPTTASL